MNILSHYFIEQEKDKPYYNFGLILPDLSGVANRAWKPGRFTDHAAEWYDDIVAGSTRHLKHDAVFHSLEAFKENVSFIRKKFESYNIQPEGSRLFFVAHIFFELMLDRMILLKDKTEADKFYKELEALDLAKIEFFFEHNRIGNTHTFLDFFNRFLEHKYIYNYVLDDHLFFALNRIMQRGKQPVFDEAVKPAFSELTAEVETHLRMRYEDIFDLMKSV